MLCQVINSATDISDTMRIPALCILALLTWSAMVNCSQQETISQANSMSSRGREDVTSPATLNALANAIQQLMLLQQQQQQGNFSGTEEAPSLQQQRNETDSQEVLNMQQQGNESESQAALSQQQHQRNETDFQETLNLQQQGNESVSETETALHIAVREMKQQLQERDETIRALRSSLGGEMHQVIEKFAALAQKQALPSKSGGGGETEGLSLKDYLGRKLIKLEAMLRALMTKEQLDKVPWFQRKLEAMERRNTAIISQLGEDLCRAAFEGRLEDVRRLLDAGADVQYASPNCYSPLVSAFYISKKYTNPNADVVSLLLARGADVKAIEKNTFYPLDLAVKTNCSRCVEMLIGAGADVHYWDTLGNSVLHWAVHMDNREIVNTLLLADANINFQAWDGNWKNKTPVDIAHSDNMRELLLEGPDFE